MKDIKHYETQEYKHENCECLCYHCNQLQNDEDDLNLYVIKDRQGDSLFANEIIYIQLCPKCVQELEVEDTWFDNEMSNGKYLNENYIYNLIKTFPIENQEYVLNSYVVGVGKRMSREDWINDNK